MKRILYIPHIPWKWVKQRPQFIAEELSNSYEVLVLLNKEYKSEYKGDFYNDGNLMFCSVFRLPFNRINVINKINLYLWRIKIKKIIKEYDIVWVSSPEQYLPISNLISNRQKLIYDCMDDILEFPKAKADKEFAKKLFCAEEKLMKNVDAVICSAVNLRRILKNRYHIETNKIKVVNNAVSIDLIKQRSKICCAQDSDGEYKHITYIGTIDEWFDFSLLDRLAEKFDRVIFDLYGPVVYKPKKINARVRLHGGVPHENIVEIMNSSDMLIMPFLVTPLIESVNPVKLYEYILSGKPTVAVRYEETKYFSDYVYLYNTDEEIECYIRMMMDQSLQPMKTIEEAIDFCTNNTWSERAKKICHIIDGLDKESV